MLDALSFQFEEMNLESGEKSLGAVAWSTDKPTQVIEEEEEDEDDGDDEDEDDEDGDDGEGLEFMPGRTYQKLCRQLLNVRVWTVWACVTFSCCYIILSVHSNCMLGWSPT